MPQTLVPLTRPLLALLATALLLVGCGATPLPTPASTPPPEAARTTEVSAVTAAALKRPVPAPTAFTPRSVNGRLIVALDPGHGGDEVGAAAYGVVERESNLDMALRSADYLRAAGVEPLLTREDAGRAPGAITGSGFSATRGDLQARVKAANAAGAAVFVSLHSNGSSDSGQRGIEVYYESRREFAEDNLRLAREILAGATDSLSAAGYWSPNRGVIDAACWRSNNGRCVGLFILSPGGLTTSGGIQTVKEPTLMPAVLAEFLFISNPNDAALLNDPAARDALARGAATGILRYLGLAQ